MILVPTQADHLAAARQNEVFASDLAKDGRHYDWAVVGLFYAAVHYGRAYMVTSGLAVTSHRGFATHFVRRSGEISLYRYYRQLQDESERARYDCASYTADDVYDADQKLLTPWRQGILRLLDGSS